MEETAALVRRARSGDREAFAMLVRRHLRTAYAVALAELRRPADAEDAAQDACVRAMQRLGECDPERFLGWFVQIARNRARDLRRQRRDTDPIPEIGTAPRERHDLLAALEVLGETEREVLLLSDLEGWTHKEIADALGISETNSRQHAFVARKKLRERLSHE